MYTSQQVESAWYASSEALGSKWGKGISSVVSNGPSRTPPVSEGCDAGRPDRKRQLETDGQEQILLLRHVWEQQGQLSPFQAADLAYFIARRKNPPERLLHQLVSHVLHSHPERRLSVLRIHRKVVTSRLSFLVPAAPAFRVRSLSNARSSSLALGGLFLVFCRLVFSLYCQLFYLLLPVCCCLSPVCDFLFSLVSNSMFSVRVSPLSLSGLRLA